MDEDSWTVERFQLELLNAEKTGKFTCEDLEPLWEKAKSAIQNEEEAVSLYTTFIYLTLRMLKKQGIVDFTKVEQLFEEASCFIDECFEQYSESSIQLEKNYANFLYTKMGKVEKAREIWARLLDGETGPFAWLEAISLERNYGNIENARRLFYKALDNVSFRPHIIYSAFVQFEREEGNRSDLDNALERVNLLASKIREEDIQQQKRKRKQDGKQQQNEREKGNFKRAAKVPKVERKGGKDINSKETSLPQKTKQGKLDLLKNEEQMDIDNTNLIENSITKTTTFETCNVPIGPIIPQINNQNNEKINNTKKEVVKEDLQQQQSSAFPYSTSLEKNKLFVKHLHFGCKEDELKDLFSKFGNVLDVRIITKWNGRSKGCAYVDFEKDSEASAAVLGANGALIRGKQIEVYLSNPSIKKREKPMEEAVKPSTSSDKNEGNISTKKEHKKPQNSLNFIPRAAQRIGKASRLDLSTNISKNLNNGENIK